MDFSPILSLPISTILIVIAIILIIIIGTVLIMKFVLKFDQYQSQSSFKLTKISNFSDWRFWAGLFVLIWLCGGSILIGWYKDYLPNFLTKILFVIPTRSKFDHPVSIADIIISVPILIIIFYWAKKIYQGKNK